MHSVGNGVFEGFTRDRLCSVCHGAHLATDLCPASSDAASTSSSVAQPQQHHDMNPQHNGNGHGNGGCLSCGASTHQARGCPLVNKGRSWSVASGSSLDSAGLPPAFGNHGIGFGSHGSAAAAAPMLQRAEQPSPFQPITEHSPQTPLRSPLHTPPTPRGVGSNGIGSKNSHGSALSPPGSAKRGTGAASAATAAEASGATAGGSSRRKKKKKKGKKASMSQDMGADELLLMSGGGGDTTGGGGAATCFNCDEPGHLSRDCSKPRACFLCGEFSHVAKNCQFSALKDANGAAADDQQNPNQQNPQQPQPQPQPLQLQSQQLQPEEQRPSPAGAGAGAGGSQQLCLNCSEAGHRLKNCPHARKCFQCGLTGHVARLCPNVSLDKKLLQKRHAPLSAGSESAPTSPRGGFGGGGFGGVDGSGLGFDFAAALGQRLGGFSAAAGGGGGGGGGDAGRASIDSVRELFGGASLTSESTPSPSPQFGTGNTSAATTPARPQHQFSGEAPPFVPAHLQHNQQHQHQQHQQLFQQFQQNQQHNSHAPFVPALQHEAGFLPHDQQFQRFQLQEQQQQQQRQRQAALHALQTSPFAPRAHDPPSFHHPTALRSESTNSSSNSSSSSAAGSYADRNTPSPFGYSPFGPSSSDAASVPLAGRASSASFDARADAASPPALFLDTVGAGAGAFSAFIGAGAASARGASALAVTEEDAEVDDALLQDLVSSLLTDNA